MRIYIYYFMKSEKKNEGIINRMCLYLEHESNADAIKSAVSPWSVARVGSSRLGSLGRYSNNIPPFGGLKHAQRSPWSALLSGRSWGEDICATWPMWSISVDSKDIVQSLNSPARVVMPRLHSANDHVVFFDLPRAAKFAAGLAPVLHSTY